MVAVDLWEISIVIFPLLAGARVRAVKQVSSPPKLSHARTRAEPEWAKAVGAACAADLPWPLSRRAWPSRQRRS